MPDAGTTTAPPNDSAPPPEAAVTPEPVDAPSVAADPVVVDDTGNDDAQLDAALAAIHSGKGREAATKAYAKVEAAPASTPEPGTQAGDAAAPGTTPADAPVAQPFQPSDEQRQLLQRFQLDESILTSMDAPRAARLFANLKQRHDDQAALWAENQKLKRGQPAPQAPATDPPAAEEAEATEALPTPAELKKFAKPMRDALAECATEFGADSPTYKAMLLMASGQQRASEAIDAQAAKQQQAIDAQVARQQQEAAAFWRKQADADQAAGIDALPKDVGVNLDFRTTEGKANKDQLIAKANHLLAAKQIELNHGLTPEQIGQGQGWTPTAYGWKDAISDAFPTVFKAQTILAQRKRYADEARKTARGGADPGGLPNRTTKPESEDAIYDRILAAQREGATRQELERIGAGRG